jgi:hypothetical protein
LKQICATQKFGRIVRLGKKHFGAYQNGTEVAGGMDEDYLSKSSKKEAPCKYHISGWLFYDLQEIDSQICRSDENPRS